jgi:hypothetical protein
MVLEYLQSAHIFLFVRSIEACRVFQPLFLFGWRKQIIKTPFTSDHWNVFWD